MKKPKKELTVVKGYIDEYQQAFILQKTPREHIYTRPAKGGGTWDYVTGVYVKKVLNATFGWMWDFEVVRAWQEAGQVITHGRLVIRDKEGNKKIQKDQFGRADVKTRKGTQTPLDLGNDYKASATDALKKCASELGIASDVYGKNEFKEIETETVTNLPKPEKKKEKTLSPLDAQKILEEKRNKLKNKNENND